MGNQQIGIDFIDLIQAPVQNFVPDPGFRTVANHLDIMAQFRQRGRDADAEGNASANADCARGGTVVDDVAVGGVKGDVNGRAIYKCLF